VDRSALQEIEETLIQMKKVACLVCKLNFKEKYTKKSLLKTAARNCNEFKCEASLKQKLRALMAKIDLAVAPESLPFPNFKPLLSRKYFSLDENEHVDVKSRL